MITQSRPLLGDGGEWIFNAIKRNPEGLRLSAAGAVLMMRTSSPQLLERRLSTPRMVLLRMWPVNRPRRWPTS